MFGLTNLCLLYTSDAADEAIAIELLETPPPTDEGGENEDAAAQSSDQDDSEISQAEY